MIKTTKYFLILAILYSCSNKESIDLTTVKDNILAKIELQKEATNKALTEEINSSFVYFKDTVNIPSYTKQLYNDTVKPLWSNGYKPNTVALSFIETIKNAHFYGLDSSQFNLRLLTSIYDSLNNNFKNTALLASLDVLFTNELVKFVHFNNTGRLAKTITDSVILNLTVTDLTENQITIIKKGLANNNLTAIFDSISPKNPFYLPLQHGLKSFFTNHKLSKERVFVQIMKPDSAKAYDNARLALLTYNYLDSSNYTNDSIFILKLKAFQHQHGLNNDGKIGSATAKMLSMSNYDRFKLAAVSLERLRMRKFDTSFFFLANIPSYELNIIENNKITKQFRVVVGKNDTRTPTFSAKMEYFILNPYWAIPYSISSKEILPKIKANTSEIANKGYTITDMNMKTVEASTVDWSKVTSSNFKYRITQTRSGATALGRVKFIFPNDYSIYLHDTPSKSFFDYDVRAYSHGCVRLQNPLDLAEYILAKQNPAITLDSINNIINSGQQKRFNVETPIQVHIDYYTSLADADNNIQFFNDIYGKDEVYKNALFSLK